ncbi:hypothetical protein [Roseateles sp. P5_D6]
MRLDNYSVAPFESLDAFDPVQRDADAPRHGASEAPAPEPVIAEETPSRLLAEMARQPPVFVLLPEPGPMRRLPRLVDGDRWPLRQREPEGRFERFERFERDGGQDGELPSHTPASVAEVPVPAPPPAPAPPSASEPASVEAAPAPAPVEAVAPIEAPPPAAAPTPPAANTGTVALPLGPAVNPDWLNQREAALKGVRAEFEAAREAARQAPPADVAQAIGSGWVAAQTDHDGNPVNGAVFVPDTAAAAAAPESVPAWMLREGMGAPAPQGQWLSFDEGTYEQAYRERLAERPEASAPLNKLAELYGQPVQQLLGTQPGLWALGTQDHAINAGPPPQPGVAMGDAASLGQLDLYLADPFLTQLRTQLGGAPAAPTSSLALEQQRLYGTERVAELTQLSQAMAAVRQTHAAAMQAARDGGGTGWIEVPLQFGTDPETGWPTGIYQTVGDGEILRDASGAPVLATQRVFDEAAFTNAWLAQGGLAQEAFARFYGQAHSQITLQQDNSESGGPPRWVSQPGLDNPHAALGDSGVWDGDLVALDLNRAPKLNNDAGVGFDPQLGWVTSRDNLYEHRNWFERAMPVVMVAFVSWATAGAASAAGWGAVGSAAAAGAAASFAGGVINGNLSLKGVLIGAVSGALTAGLTPGLTNTLKDAGLGAAAGVAARMTVQGGIQALLGGKFKDGAIAGFASGLADLTSANVGESIDKAVKAGTMSATEAMAARTFNTMLSSAIRAAGTPGDPAQAFAQDWLGSLMQEQLPAPAPAPTMPDPDGVQAFPLPGPGDVEVRPLPPAGPLFDDEGNLMPGAVDANASVVDQAGQIYEGLLAQGLTQEDAADLASDYLAQHASAPASDAAAQAAWAAMTPEQRELHLQDVQQQIEFQLRSQEINDASIQDPADLLISTGGGGARGAARGGIGSGGFEMVRNGDWDAKLNLASDPFGLLGEVANLQGDLAKLQRIQIEDRIQTMRQGMEALGVKGLPEGFVAGLDGSRDYQSTVDRLQGAYEDHVRNQRLRAAWGDDYANVRIGRSGMTVLEFEKKVLDLQQRAADAAYKEAVAKIASGELPLKNNDFALTAGTYMDAQVRAQLRFMGRGEGIPDSSSSVLWAVNRRITDGQQVGIPDNRIGANFYADTSLSRKQPSSEQLQRWNNIRSGSFLIVRPTELGGSYAIPKVLIPDPKTLPPKH